MNKKYSDLTMLAKNLSGFYPEYEGHFMCPTCLETIPISKLDRISKAHIVPQSVGGGITTYLCRECNSRFGTSQDKWFGEYVHALRSSKGIFGAKTQSGSFRIDGSRVGGWYKAQDGHLDFFIDTRNTSPAELSKLSKMNNASSIKVTVPHPLLKNAHLIDVGFLTAAYLLWFRSAGYSWVLQEHLDPVRQQILNPNNSTLGLYCVNHEGNQFPKATIGIGVVEGEFVLLMTYADRVVILPAAGNPGAYERIPRDSPEMKLREYRAMVLARSYDFPQPFGCFFDDYLLIAPDPIIKNVVPGIFIRMSSRGEIPKVLRPMTKEHEALLQDDGAVVEEIKASVRMPSKLTGRR